MCRTAAMRRSCPGRKRRAPVGAFGRYFSFLNRQPGQVGRCHFVVFTSISSDAGSRLRSGPLPGGEGSACCRGRAGQCVWPRRLPEPPGRQAQAVGEGRPVRAWGRGQGQASGGRNTMARRAGGKSFGAYHFKSRGA